MVLKLELKKLACSSRLHCSVILALTITLAGCAHQRNQSKSTPHRDARIACKRLSRTELSVPVQTQFKPEMKRIKELRSAGKRRMAAARARALYLACADEADKRENLRPIIEIVEKDRASLDPRLYTHFQSLVQRADYAQATLCGEGILQRNPENCGFTSPHARRAGSTVKLKAGNLPPTKSTKLATSPKTTAAPHTPASPSAQASAVGSTGAEGAADHGPAPAQEEFQPQDEDVAGEAPAGFEQRPMSRKRLWSWILMGTGVGLLASGGIMAGLAQSKYNELEETCPYCYQRDIDAGERRAISADILFGVGGAALATGVALMIWDLRTKPPRDHKSATLPQLNLSPSGVSISGRY